MKTHFMEDTVFGTYVCSNKKPSLYKDIINWAESKQSKLFHLIGFQNKILVDQKTTFYYSILIKKIYPLILPSY